jgi:cytochrome o ubiquinol oxidase operon protein cyoD
MNHHDADPVDYGTGQKKLGIYVSGIISCTILTLISFWAVMSGKLSKWEMFIVIFASACIQFLVQVVSFLRLNTQTEQGKTNVLALIFTGIILICIIIGSLWIMGNLSFYTIR